VKICIFVFASIVLAAVVVRAAFAANTVVEVKAVGAQLLSELDCEQLGQMERLLGYALSQ
jgi:hypothetical protein